MFSGVSFSVEEIVHPNKVTQNIYGFSIADVRVLKNTTGILVQILVNARSSVSHIMTNSDK